MTWELPRIITSFIDRKIDWIEQPLRKSLIMFGAHFFGLGIASFIYTYSAFILTDSRPLSYSYNGYMFLYFMPMDHTLIGLFFGLFRNSRNFLLAWKESINKVEVLEREQAEYQLQALKNQVNPHFLFNNLNTLISLIHQQPNTAEKFGNQLALVYRYLLEEKDRNIIPIEKELGFLESYIYLLKIRFGENLRINLPLAQLKEFFIAPFTLQLLLENAIKHNVVSQECPLQIDIELAGNRIIVSNQLHLRNSQQLNSTGWGHQNLKARYEMVTEDPVVITETKERFEVSIPVFPVKQFRRAATA